MSFPSSSFLSIVIRFRWYCINWEFEDAGESKNMKYVNNFIRNTEKELSRITLSLNTALLMTVTPQGRIQEFQNGGGGGLGAVEGVGLMPLHTYPMFLLEE